MTLLKKFQNKTVIYCFLLLALISYYEYYSIEESLSNFDYVGGRNAYKIIFCLLVIIILSYGAFRNNFKIWHDDRLARKYSFFMLFSFIISFLFFISGSRYYVLSSPLKWISPLFVFWAIYSLVYKINDTQLMSKFALMMMVVLILGYFASYRYFVEVTFSSDSHTQLISSYFALLILPLVLCTNSKALKFSAIVVIAIVLLSSAKRGGFLAFVGAIFIYYLTKSITSGDNRHQVLYLLIFVIGVVFSLLGIKYLLQYSDIYMFERLSLLHEDEGSGRTEVYKEVINMIENSHFTGFLFGHGFSAVGFDSPLQMGAHNDFLEVIYDYGVVGISLYLALHVELIKYTIGLVKDKSKFAAPMAMSYSIFFFLSNVSQVIIYPFFEILFAIVWSSIMASRKHELIEKNIVKS